MKNAEENKKIKGVVLAYAYTLMLDIDYKSQIGRVKVRLKAPTNRSELEAFNLWLSSKPEFEFDLCRSRIGWG